MEVTALNPASLWIKENLLWIKLAVFVLFVGLVFWAGWKVCDWRWESKENTEKQALIDKVAQQQKDWEADKLRWDQASQITATNLSVLETQKDTLMAALNGFKGTRTITVKPNAEGNCESPVLSDAFRLRWNAVVSTAAASPTADHRK